MILHRFMSDHEYNKLVLGERLINRHDHARERGQLTTSVGFCFFPEEPADAIHWLSGCVNCDVCVTLDIPDHLLTKSVGTYRDPKSDLFSYRQPKVKRTEYCLQEYCLSDVTIKSISREFADRMEIVRAFQQMGLIPAWI